MKKNTETNTPGGGISNSTAGKSNRRGITSEYRDLFTYWLEFPEVLKRRYCPTCTLCTVRAAVTPSVSRSFFQPVTAAGAAAWPAPGLSSNNGTYSRLYHTCQGPLISVYMSFVQPESQPVLSFFLLSQVQLPFFWCRFFDPWLFSFFKSSTKWHYASYFFFRGADEMQKAGKDRRGWLWGWKPKNCWLCRAENADWCLTASATAFQPAGPTLEIVAPTLSLWTKKKKIC